MQWAVWEEGIAEVLVGVMMGLCDGAMVKVKVGIQSLEGFEVNVIHYVLEATGIVRENTDESVIKIYFVTFEVLPI